MAEADIWMMPLARRRPAWSSVAAWASVERPAQPEFVSGIVFDAGFYGQIAPRVTRVFGGSTWSYLDDATLALLQRVAQLQTELLDVQQRRNDQPRTTQATLHELASDWALDRPICATVESYDDHVIARVPDLSVFGEGDTELEALEDLRANLVDLAEQLDELEPGSELAERWKRLVRPVARAATR